ncbi:MAG: hypothetical protein ACI4KJ_06645 [Anaerovoracaceae bacterium]
MNKIQNRILELLSEVDRICRDNGIFYSLAENTAISVVKEGVLPENEYLGELVMTLDNYSRFLDACRNSLPEGRALENAVCNPKMDGAYSRYVNTETTLVDFKRGTCFKYQGLFVAVRPIMNYKPSSKLDRLRVTAVQANARPHIREELKYSRKKKKPKLAALLILRPFLSNALSYFNKCMTAQKGGKQYYYTGFREKVTVPKDITGTYCDIECSGLKLMCFEKKDAWIKLISANSNNGKSAESRYDYNAMGVVADPYVPYSRFFKAAEACGLSGSSTNHLYGEYLKFKALKHDPKKAKVDKDWLYVRRTKDRFSLYDRYRQNSEEIASEYSCGNEEYARRLLAPYIRKIKEYANLGMGFSIDRELFNICLDIMRKDGEEALARKASKLLPAEFKESVGEYLEREGFRV